MAYEYLNTRLRYLKARLLRPSEFGSYLDMDDFDEFTAALAETDYADELERASVEHTGYNMVEQAIVAHTQRVFQKLHNIAFDEPKQLIALILERFEVFNLKTIFRGFHAGTDPDTIRESLFPTILYPTSFYETLLDREGIGAIIDELLTVGNRYYRPLAQAYSEYESNGQLALMELALDRHYFAGSRTLLDQLDSANADAVRHMLGTEVDILNLVYAMRVLDTTVDAAERDRYVLGGGDRLDERTIQSLLESPDRASFIRTVEETYYGRRLGALDESLDANAFQEQLENLLYREMTHLEPGQFFDIGLAATYIWRINAEAINLRVIAGGLYRRASRAEIERRLIKVPGMIPEEVAGA